MVENIKHIGSESSDSRYPNLTYVQEKKLRSIYGDQILKMNSREKFMVLIVSDVLDKNIESILSWHHKKVIVENDVPMISRSHAIYAGCDGARELIFASSWQEPSCLKDDLEKFCDDVDFVHFMKKSEIFQSYAEKVFTSLSGSAEKISDNSFWQLCEEFSRLNISKELTSESTIISSRDRILTKIKSVWKMSIHKKPTISKVKIGKETFIILHCN